MIAPELHPGQRCSSDCAEYGCGSWTGVDERTLADRRRAERIAERIRRATDHLGRGTYGREASSHGARGGRVDPLDGPHVPYPQPDER